MKNIEQLEMSDSDIDLAERISAEANKRLLVASPKLLAACKAMIQTIESHNVPVASYLCRDFAQAKAAVAQAEGEQP